MIYVLYGPDEISKREALHALAPTIDNSFDFATQRELDLFKLLGVQNLFVETQIIVIYNFDLISEDALRKVIALDNDNDTLVCICTKTPSPKKMKILRDHRISLKVFSTKSSFELLKLKNKHIKDSKIQFTKDQKELLLNYALEDLISILETLTYTGVKLPSDNQLSLLLSATDEPNILPWDLFKLLQTSSIEEVLTSVETFLPQEVFSFLGFARKAFERVLVYECLEITTLEQAKTAEELVSARHQKETLALKNKLGSHGLITMLQYLIEADKEYKLSNSDINVFNLFLYRAHALFKV